MKKKIINILCIVFFIFICLFYLESKVTFTSYKSNVDASIDVKPAVWNINIDNESINNLEVDKSILLNNVNWQTPHVRENKLAPGSKGKVLINVNAQDTDVAIVYSFTIVDNTINKKKLLRVESISSSNTNIVKTGPSTYTSILLLPDIKKGFVPQYEISLVWDNTGDIDYNSINFDGDNFMTVSFSAKQYRGEDIIPYEENNI